MAKRDQLRRLLKIDRRIRERNHPSPDQLSSELEVSRRVIFNDRNYLRDVLSAPLEYCRKHGGWYYSEPTWVLPWAFVTRGEMVALVLAVEAAKNPLGALLRDELGDAVEKLTTSLGEHVSADMAMLMTHLTFGPEATVAISGAQSPFILTLREAVEKRQLLRVRYHSSRSRTTKWRAIEPHHLHNDGSEWRVFAFEPSNKEMRTFNVARIDQLEVTGHSFVRQANFRADEFLKNSFRQEFGPRLHDIAIRFDAQQAPYIREKTWHATQKLEEQADGDVILRFQASGLNEITRWVLGYGGHAEVLSPPELRSLVCEAVASLSVLYQIPTVTPVISDSSHSEIQHPESS